MLPAPLIVLDTNVLVAGLCRREKSPSYRIFKSIQAGDLPVALSSKMLLEYEDVLHREKILALIVADHNDIDMILNALLALAQKSQTYFLWRPNLPDEGDNHILETAIASGACIVTKNIKDFARAELMFPDLLVLTPQQFCNLYLNENERST